MNPFENLLGPLVSLLVQLIRGEPVPDRIGLLPQHQTAMSSIETGRVERCLVEKFHQSLDLLFGQEMIARVCISHDWNRRDYEPKCDGRQAGSEQPGGFLARHEGISHVLPPSWSQAADCRPRQPTRSRSEPATARGHDRQRPEDSSSSSPDSLMPSPRSHPRAGAEYTDPAATRADQGMCAVGIFAKHPSRTSMETARPGNAGVPPASSSGRFAPGPPVRCGRDARVPRTRRFQGRYIPLKGRRQARGGPNLESPPRPAPLRPATTGLSLRGAPARSSRRGGPAGTRAPSVGP